MKRLYISVGIVLVIGGIAIAQADKFFSDKGLGLSKTSVFEVPTPEPFDYNEAFPGTSKILPRAYPGAPPQIPHNIQMFTPITAANNACLACHDKRELIGKKAAGQPTPIPLSHYTDLRHAPDKAGKKLVGARYLCTQCHVPQGKVPPLVENNFSSKSR